MKEPCLTICPTRHRAVVVDCRRASLAGRPDARILRSGFIASFCSANGRVLPVGGYGRPRGPDPLASSGKPEPAGTLCIDGDHAGRYDCSIRREINMRHSSPAPRAVLRLWNCWW